MWPVHIEGSQGVWLAENTAGWFIAGMQGRFCAVGGMLYSEVPNPKLPKVAFVAP